MARRPASPARQRAGRRGPTEGGAPAAETTTLFPAGAVVVVVVMVAAAQHHSDGSALRDTNTQYSRASAPWLDTYTHILRMPSRAGAAAGHLSVRAVCLLLRRRGSASFSAVAVRDCWLGPGGVGGGLGRMASWGLGIEMLTDWGQALGQDQGCGPTTRSRRGPTPWRRIPTVCL